MKIKDVVHQVEVDICFGLVSSACVGIGWNSVRTPYVHL